jgi:MFS family permease
LRIAVPNYRRGRAQLAFLLVHTVLVQLAAFVLRPASTYRALELDVPAVWLGVLSACFAVAPLILALPSGQAVDRFGERRVMLVGAALVAVACATFVLVGGGVIGLVAANVLLGIGHFSRWWGSRRSSPTSRRPDGTTRRSTTTASPRRWGRRWVPG